jgi:hypothetical protein
MPCPRIAEGGVDAERIAVWLAGEAALGAEAHALVLHPLVGDLGVLRVGPDLEREEVGEVETSGSLQPAENLVGRSGEAQIDVPSGPGAVEAKLEDEPSLQRGRVAQDGDHPRQEAIEHQELAPTGEVRAVRRRGAEALLKGLLEGLGRSVLVCHHAGSPPKAFRDALTSGSSARTTSPRCRACFVACCRRSGDTPSRAQSLRVRFTEVMGTGPNQVRSRLATSA